MNVLYKIKGKQTQRIMYKLTLISILITLLSYIHISEGKPLFLSLFNLCIHMIIQFQINIIYF